MHVYCIARVIPKGNMVDHMKDVVTEYEEWLRGKQNVSNFSHGRRMLCADGGPNRDPANLCHCRAVVPVIHLHLRNQVRPRKIATIFRLEPGASLFYSLTLRIMSSYNFHLGTAPHNSDHL